MVRVYSLTIFIYGIIRAALGGNFNRYANLCETGVQRTIESGFGKVQCRGASAGSDELETA
jgi:hypothetical protein